MEKLYKISKKYEATKYCSEITINDITYYLLKDDGGKTIKDLAKTPYEITLMLLNYQSLCGLNKNNEI